LLNFQEHPIKLPSNITIKTISKPNAQRSSTAPKAQLENLMPQSRKAMDPLNDCIYNINAYLNSERFALAGRWIFGSEPKIFFPLQMKLVSSVDQNETWTLIQRAVEQDKKLIVLNFEIKKDSSPIADSFTKVQRFGHMLCLRKDMEQFYLIAIDSKTTIPPKIAETFGFMSVKCPLLLGIAILAPQKLPKHRQRLIPPESRTQLTLLQRVPFLPRNIRKFGVTVIYMQQRTELLPASLPKKHYNTRENPKKSGLKQNKNVVKRKYTKKTTGTKPYQYKRERKAAHSSRELSPTDNEMSFLLENLKSDADNKILLDSIETPSHLLSSTMILPIDMELDVELSGPLEANQAKEPSPKILQKKMYGYEGNLFYVIKFFKLLDFFQNRLPNL
jgi:hypothetical protein